MYILPLKEPTLKIAKLQNSTESDEVAHYEPPHLHLCCFPFSFLNFQYNMALTKHFFFLNLADIVFIFCLVACVRLDSFYLELFKLLFLFAKHQVWLGFLLLFQLFFTEEPEARWNEFIALSPTFRFLSIKIYGQCL